MEASSTTTTTQHYGRLHLAALRPVTEFGGFSWNVLVQILITRCLNSRTLGVALQQADNGWIALGSLKKKTLKVCLHLIMQSSSYKPSKFRET